MSSNELSFEEATRRIKYILGFLENNSKVVSFTTDRCNEMMKVISYLTCNGHIKEEDHNDECFDLKCIINDLKRRNDMVDLVWDPDMDSLIMSPEECLEVFTRDIKEMIGELAYEKLLNTNYTDKEIRNYIRSLVREDMHFDPNSDHTFNMLCTNKMSLEETICCMIKSIAMIGDNLFVVMHVAEGYKNMVVKMCYDDFIDNIQGVVKFHMDKFIQHTYSLQDVFEIIEEKLSYDHEVCSSDNTCWMSAKELGC